MADIPLIMDQNGRTRQMTAQEYKAATGRISAAPRNPRYMGGLNNNYALQNRNVPAFPDPRRPGMSAGEIAEDAASMGYTIGAQGVLPSYMPNNPQGQMTAEQLRQFNIAAAKASGNFSAIREKFLRENPGDTMDRRGNIVRGGAKATAPAPAMKPGTFVDDTPGAASAKAREKFFGGMPKRDGTVAGAAGVDLEKLRPSFDALPTPPTIPTPSAPTREGGNLTNIKSKYGTGSIKFLKPGEARPVSMTVDDFGRPDTMKNFLERRKASAFERPETMKSFLERRKAIQKSKGMT